MIRSGETVAIFGLGVLGGSLARELAAQGARVIGADVDPEQLQRARDAGVVHADVGDDLEPLRAAAVVVLAVPVDVAAAVLERVAPFLGTDTLVTDVGSTKGALAEQARRLGLGQRFVGAHPMAGDHRTGFAASRVGLFAGARVFLCADDAASAATRDAAVDFWSAVGAEVHWHAAEAHDHEVAYTSHLPHLLSVVLQRTLAGAGHEATALGAGGRDMTRLAGSSPAMWRGIVATNRTAISEALADCARELDLMRALLATHDDDAVARRFSEAGAWRAAITEPARDR